MNECKKKKVDLFTNVLDNITEIEPLLLLFAIYFLLIVGKVFAKLGDLKITYKD